MPANPLRRRRAARARRRRRNDRERPAAADVRDEPVAVRACLQLECLVQRCGRLAPDQCGPWSLYSSQAASSLPARLPRSPRPGRGLVRDGRAFDRPGTPAPRSARPLPRHLASQRVQFVADRGAGEHAVSSPDQGRGLRLEVGDEVGCDPACRLLVEHASGPGATAGSSPGEAAPCVRAVPRRSRAALGSRRRRSRPCRRRARRRRRATSTRRSRRSRGSSASSGRAAQTIASAPSSATFAQNSVFAGAISSTASSPIETA